MSPEELREPYECEMSDEERKAHRVFLAQGDQTKWGPDGLRREFPEGVIVQIKKDKDGYRPTVTVTKEKWRHSLTAKKSLVNLEQARNLAWSLLKGLVTLHVLGEKPDPAN